LRLARRSASEILQCGVHGESFLGGIRGPHELVVEFDERALSPLRFSTDALVRDPRESGA